MKRTLYLLSLVALLLLAGCNDPKHVTDTLTRAGALMNEYPDSVWAMLNTLSPDDMGQSRTRALYALLYTQAQDKNYIDETSDSLISIAVDYYRNTDDVRHKFLSFYYKGRVHFNAEDYLNATLCYMEAEQLADEVEDDYLTGLLYAELGRIYRLYYDYPKSLEAHQKAAKCYERAGKIRHRNYMWYNQSGTYRNMNKYNESELLYCKTLDSAKGDDDKTLIELCLGSLVMSCIEQNRMAEAKKFYAELNLLVGEEYGSPSFMGKLSKLYLFERDYMRAKQCIETGWSRAVNRKDSVHLLFSTAELLRALGDEKAAYGELIKGASLQTDEAYEALQQPILTAQRDYLSEKLEFETYKLRMERHLRILYILLFSLLLVLVAFFSFRKLKKEKEKARKTIDELNNEMLLRDKESRYKIESLLAELEGKDKSASTSILGLRSELQKQEEDYHRYIQESEELQHCLEERLAQKTILGVEVFKNWFASMSKLILILIQKGIEETKNKKLRKEITLWQEKYYEGNKAFREVERLVNLYNDDAMLHFREEMQWTEEADYRRTCYFFAGFSIHLIAILMNETDDSVYQKRHRLRKYLETSDLLHKDLYLVLLCK